MTSVTVDTRILDSNLVDLTALEAFELDHEDAFLSSATNYLSLVRSAPTGADFAMRSMILGTYMLLYRNLLI